MLIIKNQQQYTRVPSGPQKASTMICGGFCFIPRFVRRILVEAAPSPDPQKCGPCPLDPGDLAPMSGRNRETEENTDTVPSAGNGKARFEQPLPIHLEKKTFPEHKSLARLFKHTTINGKNLSKKKKTRKEDKASPESPREPIPPFPKNRIRRQNRQKLFRRTEESS